MVFLKEEDTDDFDSMDDTDGSINIGKGVADGMEITDLTNGDEHEHFRRVLIESF